MKAPQLPRSVKLRWIAVLVLGFRERLLQISALLKLVRWSNAKLELPNQWNVDSGSLYVFRVHVERNFFTSLLKSRNSAFDLEISIVADEQSQYWSKVARKYDYVVDLQIGGKTRSLIRERVAKEGRLGTLVEFGCGTGYYTGVLSEKADSIVATDISPGMLALGKKQIKAENVKFQLEDCQKTSFPDGAFDTAFMSLVIHFTEPEKTLAEMRRILKPGGTLIITNLDPGALNALNRIRCIARVIYNGLARYRVKPPKGSADHLLTEEQLCGLLRKSGFKVLGQETISDTSRSSNIPVDYIRAVKI